MKNIFYLLFLFFTLTFSQETITVSGDVKDTESGETLIGATIYIPALQVGTTSNAS